jgi:hypothetical protein
VRNRRLGYVAVAAMVALVLAVGLPRAGNGPPPAKDVPKTVDLDRVLAPRLTTVAPPVAAKDTPVTLHAAGRVTTIDRDRFGRLLVTAAEPGNQSWTLRYLAPDGTALSRPIRFASAGDAAGDADEHTAVLALRGGGPLPQADRFLDRRDGLLRVDLPSGRVLGFTRIPLVSDVAMAPDGTAWAVTPHRLLHLDPRTGRRLGGHPTPGLVNQVRYGKDTLWLTYAGATPTVVFAVDSDSGALRATYSSQDGATMTRVPGATVLVGRAGRLVRIADDGSVTAVQLLVPRVLEPRIVAGVDDDLWLSIGETLLRVDGRSLAFEGGASPAWAGPYSLARRGSRLLVTEATTGQVHSFRESAFRTRR